MSDLGDAIDRLATETRFSGVVRVDRGDGTELARAYGFADRRCAQPNTVDTRLGIASGGKAFTALAVITLIEDGVLTLDTTARSLLGPDLPLIDDAVTIEHLLAHRSGIGDYIDEDDPDGEITDYVLSRPLFEYTTIEAFLPDLEGHPQKFAPDERFAYCNGGFVVLALLAERASGVSYHELVEQRVCYPAGLDDTEFLRADELPATAAIGYLDPEGSGSDRTNVFHLPVLAPGDGGIYSTVADMHAFWNAFLGEQIVSDEWIAEMIRPRSNETGESKRYGLGFWLHQTNDAVMLEGYDAGVSFKTVHDPATQITHTVISNWSEGAWPVTRALDDLLGLT
jgi:CubicO group peptidase (beta-lactamase class C family)